jgi:hypothetical protein
MSTPPRSDYTPSHAGVAEIRRIAKWVYIHYIYLLICIIKSKLCFYMGILRL